MSLCPHCGGDADPASTCPRAVACPHCGAAPGAPCRRPSGHRAMTLHADRWRHAEERDAAAGLTTTDDTPTTGQLALSVSGQEGTA